MGTQEFMNRGTIQDWIDDNSLSVGGMFVTIEKVATALAYMHANKVTHNDIKPENVLLHQLNASDKFSEVDVKLGDLGCANKSDNTNDDYWQFGMTIFCMIAKEKFGTRKYRADDAMAICDELSESAIAQSQLEGSCLSTLVKTLRKIFKNTISMQDISTDPFIAGWDFFAEGKA